MRDTYKNRLARLEKFAKQDNILSTVDKLLLTFKTPILCENGLYEVVLPECVKALNIPLTNNYFNNKEI